MNEAGIRWQALVKEEWNTSIVFSPTKSNNVEFTGHKGLYKIVVKSFGKPVFISTFSTSHHSNVYKDTISIS